LDLKSGSLAIFKPMFAFDYISVSAYYTKRCLATIELISGLWGHNNIELLPFRVRV
jgi:hypothetical protein